jgi:type IV secretory pathway VirB6-like protein
MDPLVGATSLSTIPAATPGPVNNAAFEIFAPLYAAVMGGIDDVITTGTATMIGYVHDFFVPMCSLGLIFMAVAEAFSMGAYLFWLTKYLVRAGVVLTLIDTAGDYARWIVTPLLHLGDTMAAGLSGALPGAPGHVFDVLMAHYAAAVVQTIERLPWSSILGALESIVLAGMALLSWLIAFLAVGTAFAVYMIIHLYLSVILIVGPLFVAVIMAGQLRNWTMGWLNAVASQVLALILLGIGLTILTKAEDQVLQSILSTADNANFWSSLGHLFGGMIALCIGGVYALTTRSIAVGIVGGVYAAMQPYATAVQNGFAMAAAIGAGRTAGNTSSSVATPAMTTPALTTTPPGNLARGP